MVFLSGDKAALTACVTACAAYKLGLVARDERDETGVREILNFGHTAGHAFEAMSHGRLPHGLAVAHGMRFALIVSREAGFLGSGDFRALGSMLDMLDLPPIPLRRDRMSTSGVPRPRRPGYPRAHGEARRLGAVGALRGDAGPGRDRDASSPRLAG